MNIDIEGQTCCWSQEDRFHDGTDSTFQRPRRTKEEPSVGVIIYLCCSSSADRLSFYAIERAGFVVPQRM